MAPRLTRFHGTPFVNDCTSFDAPLSAIVRKTARGDDAASRPAERPPVLAKGQLRSPFERRPVPFSAMLLSPMDALDILLVDDKPDNLLALEAVLASPEYNLIKASSGPEALKYLLYHDCAMLFLHVQMPGMDGFETATIIKQSERSRPIPIIFMTAISQDDHF